MCTDDVTAGLADSLVRSDVTSYRINSVEHEGSLYDVHAKIVAKSDSTDDGRIPVVQENGKWLVCFTRKLESGESLPSDGPAPDSPGLGSSSDVESTPPPGDPETTETGSGNSICNTDRSGAFAVADEYVLLATSGSTDGAEDCVYAGTVPDSLTESLNGKSYSADYGSGGETGPFIWAGGDGTHLTVTVARESDGKYYVTAVSRS
jgi:hypothetical protein